MSTKKRRPSGSHYLNQLIDAWMRETGRKSVDMNAVADWAEQKGYWSPPRGLAKKQFRRQLSRAASRRFIEDENGQPVRLMHAYNVVGTQLMLWSKLDDLTNEQMHTSAQLRRRQVQGEVLQCERDVRYFNTHYNSGDPIQLSWNFDADIAESQMPTEYPDEPPTDEGSEYE